MAIIKHIKSSGSKYAYLSIFPDQFKSEKEKQGDTWIKETMDYFANRALAEYTNNKNSFAKNYDLMKGILRSEDFYEEPEVKSFMEVLEDDMDLPAYVKHYSIITTPINELVGEITKRPDTFKVKAFDDESTSEELTFRTDLLQKFIMNTAKMKILQKAEMEGVEIPMEELEQMTVESVREELDNYTSIAEKWGNKLLTAVKAEFNLKEKSEEAFRDLTIANREFYMIYEDNSKIGFNIQTLNPKNVWYLITPDKKFISDTTGRAEGAYAAGTIHIMELSEIIETFPHLTKKEIDHLRKEIEDYGLPETRESNLYSNPDPGINSIKYDTYDPLVLQTRMLAEADMAEGRDTLEEILGVSSSVGSFGYKYVVVRGYWISKKKIGKLSFMDEMGNIQSMLVDENYKSGDFPTEVDLEWGWVNQWYYGDKIGQDIYHVHPFKLLPYCPIIGTVHEIKNTESRSILDLMKPFQVLYNVCMNQLFDLLKKEIGNVYLTSIRHIPLSKDGDNQDAIEEWELKAREKGVIFIDDSPENTKAPSAFNQHRGIDLTRSAEIQSRYELAQRLKLECWELVGMSRQRLGNIQATETATATNTAMQQSYAQTEPLFVAHEYILGQLYQAIIDASQYIESHKETSTLSYITSEGENAFFQVNGDELKFRDLRVFPTNRPEDTQMFNEIRQLSQAILQNGGSIYDVVELYSTKSLREMKKTFKELRDRQIQMQQEAQDLEKQKLEQAQQIAQAEMEREEYIRQDEQANENYQKELDRINDKEIAIIRAMGFGQVQGEDSNQNNVPDAFELTKLVTEENMASKEYLLKLEEIRSKQQESLKKLELEKEKLKVARENMANDLAIAKENAKGRAKSSKNNKK